MRRWETTDNSHASLPMHNNNNSFTSTKIVVCRREKNNMKMKMNRTRGNNNNAALQVARLSHTLHTQRTASPSPSCMACIENKRCADVRFHTDTHQTPVVYVLDAHACLFYIVLKMMRTTAWVVFRLFALFVRFFFLWFNWIQSTPTQCLRRDYAAPCMDPTCFQICVKAILM